MPTWSLHWHFPAILTFGVTVVSACVYLQPTVWSVTAALVPLFFIFRGLASDYLAANDAGSSSTASPCAYILTNRVTHARFLPKESSHAFVYPTISLLLSLRALESGQLNLWHGRLFGYGSALGRICAIGPRAYLGEGDERIVVKLRKEVKKAGFEWMEGTETWMMTMPSFMGVEGINPLTVYFCYKPGNDDLWLLVAEVHNTFSEAHVYVLECGGANSDPSPDKGYSHRWTFPRAFHVSPFNDREGFYKISIRPPPSPPQPCHSDKLAERRDLRGTSVRVHMYFPSTTPQSQSTTPGSLKLIAVTTVQQSSPLSTSSLLTLLSRYPFILLLTFARIVYQAFKLHYRLNLPVHARPEPWSDPNRGHGHGVRYQKASFLESFAKRWIEEDLRMNPMPFAITIRPDDPVLEPSTFMPSTSSAHPAGDHLIIKHASPRFYILLAMAPSPSHALLLNKVIGPEPEFVANNEKLFLRAFAVREGLQTRSTSSAQKLRLIPLPSNLKETPAEHFLDSHRPFGMALLVLATSLISVVERGVFGVFRARFVEGEEPWFVWERAGLLHRRSAIVWMGDQSWRG